MADVHNVSTAAVPERERIAFWMDGARRAQSIGPIAVDPLTKVFQARAQTRQLGPVTVFGFQATPHRVTQQCERDRPMMKIKYQRSGICIVEQNGEQRALKPGDWTVIDGSRSNIMINTEEASQISLNIPLSMLSEREIRLARTIVSSVRMSGTVSRLMFDCLRFSLEDLGASSESTEMNLGMSMIELFRAVIGDEASEKFSASSRETLELRVRDYVRRTLGDPDLSVETIAKAMGCSGRYIHKSFEGKESVTRMIWSMRLDRCRSELQCANGRRTTLTELAFNFGFSNSAHFSRMFKDRFGTTPSEYRRQAEGSPEEFEQIN